jgi:hypothetical protein
MESGRLKTVYILSLIITMLSLLASAGGLLFRDLYRDAENIKLGWLGNDLVTLVIVFPGLLITSERVRRGSRQAQLVLMGLLGYIFYNYAFYLFGAAFNVFFLLYIAIFSSSIFALSLGLSGLNAEEISRSFNRNASTKWIAPFLLFISVPLGIIEVGYCINFILTGEVPKPPSLIFALDLSIVVPNTALAAVLLFKAKSWGYILGVIMLIKAFTYGLGLSLSSIITAIFGSAGTWDPLLPFYVFITVGGFLGSIFLLKSFNENPN